MFLRVDAGSHELHLFSRDFPSLGDGPRVTVVTDGEPASSAASAADLILDQVGSGPPASDHDPEACQLRVPEIIALARGDWKRDAFNGLVSQGRLARWLPHGRRTRLVSTKIHTG